MNFSSRVFPAEILKEIFTYVITQKVPKNHYIITEKGSTRSYKNPGDFLVKKSELKACSTVCKSWNFVVNSSFFDTGIQIKLKDDWKFKSFLDDLTQFPLLGPKVKCITTTNDCEGGHDSTIFRSIVNHCPNLVKLKFEYPEVYDDIEVLDHPEALLPNIQKIHLRNMEFGFPSTRRLHLSVNYKFRATITSLRITDFGINTAVKKFGGLYKYISSFPNLKYLKIMCELDTKNAQTINLELLLESARKLEILEIYSGGGRINVETTTKIDNLPESIIPHNNDKPIKMYLKVYKINIDVLNCIMDRLKNVSTLRVEAAANYDSAYTTEMDKMIFNKFTFYCRPFHKASANIRKGDNSMYFQSGELQNLGLSDTDSDNPKSEDGNDEDSENGYDSDNLFGGGNRFFGGGSDDYGSDDSSDY